MATKDLVKFNLNALFLVGVMLELDPKYFLFDQDDYLFGRSHECDVDINDLALAGKSRLNFFLFPPPSPPFFFSLGANSNYAFPPLFFLFFQNFILQPSIA